MKPWDPASWNLSIIHSILSCHSPHQRLPHQPYDSTFLQPFLLDSLRLPHLLYCLTSVPMPRRNDYDYGRPSSSRGPPPSQQGSQAPYPWGPPPPFDLSNPPPNAFLQNTSSQYGNPVPSVYPPPGSMQPPSSNASSLGFPDTGSRPRDWDFPAAEYEYPRDFDPERSCTWISREYTCPNGLNHKKYEFRERCFEHQGSTRRCARTTANTLIQSVPLSYRYSATADNENII